MVSQTVLNLMIEMACLSFILPVFCAVLWKVRTKKSIVPVFTGMMIFVTFGIVFKSVPNMIFTTSDNPVSKFITGNTWAYALYAGLAAGILEEVGRYVGYKMFIPRHDYKEAAVSYGIGHGGIECIIVLGFSQIQNFMYAQLINAGQMEEIYETLPDENAVSFFKDMVERICSVTAAECIWGGIERVAVFAFQIALSVLVFYAATEYGKKYYLLIAIAIHTFIDIFAALYQLEILPLVVTEIIIIIFAVATSVFAYKKYREMY